MLSDPYITSSNFRPKKSASNCKVKKFFEEFEKFYIDVRARKSPDLPHQICDPYGFALLCKDYQNNSSKLTNQNISCKKSFEEQENTTYDSIFKYRFPFVTLLDLLYRAYFFDYNLALKVYNMQHDALNIFNQIMNGQGYIINRLAPHKKKVRKLINNAYDSKIGLDESKTIKIPYRNRVCDGKTWPCIITQNYSGAFLQKSEIDGYGEGLFLVGNDNLIYDVLRINDLWIVDTPLENRLKFANKSREFESAPFFKVFSWRSAFDAAKQLNCNKTNGVLVRPCFEDYFENNWFQWNKTSLLYACLINGNLQIFNKKSSQPDYYTLEGDLGEVDPREERTYERIWLDDFDIKEFQQILKLKDE